MQEGFRGLIKNGAGRKFLLMGIVILAVIVLMPVIDILLFTFLFIFLVDGAQKFLRRKLVFLNKIPEAWFAFAIYIMAAAGIIVLVYVYLPNIVGQIDVLRKFLSQLEEGTFLQNFGAPITDYIDDSDVFSLIKSSSVHVFETVGLVSGIAMEATLAIILSLFFFAEKQHLVAFSCRLEQSLFGGAYEEICEYGHKFKDSFGKVLETQVVIALVNTTITCIGLFILGFPSIFALALMVFLLSMIPVAGAIISVVPLCLIGMAIGGFKTVFFVIVLIAIVHTIEAYYLNPKLLSNKTELPAFLVFIILIISEHLIGAWGLIVGVPFFVFFLEVFENGEDGGLQD